MKTSELISPALDWAVAKCERMQIDGDAVRLFPEEYSYSTDWSQGGPIIEREKLMLWHDTRYTKYWWRAKHENNAVVFYGPTPLIAAMRCYVASKLGDEVEVPEELL